MKILMLNNEFPPLGGGTGTVNQAILNQLSSSPDLEIDLITSSPNNVYESVAFNKRIDIFKIPVDRFDIHHASNKELILYAVRSFFSVYESIVKENLICALPGAQFQLEQAHWP